MSSSEGMLDVVFISGFFDLSEAEKICRQYNFCMLKSISCRLWQIEL